MCIYIYIYVYVSYLTQRLQTQSVKSIDPYRTSVCPLLTVDIFRPIDIVTE